jgi:hypothetical protein
MDTRAAAGTMTGSDGLEPELVMPAQFFARARTDASFLPEKRLMLAVLEDAVAVYRKHVHSRYPGGRALFLEAEEWILSDDLAWPCAFVNVCQALDLDTDYIRGGVARWKALPPPANGTTPFRRISGSRSRVVVGAPGIHRAA